MRRAFCLALLVAATVACGGGTSAATCELASDCTGTASFCEVATGECIAPPSADACNRVETCTLADKPYCTDDSMGVCVECTDGSHCGDGEVCDQSSNECIVLACTEGTAGDAQCAAADPSLAYCGPDESCVACLESAHCLAADSAICDPNDLECRGCIANTECDSKVCGTDTGICASESDIVYVAKTGGADGASCGTLASPCLTIDGDEGGLAKLTASRKTVLIGAGNYVEQIVIDGQTVTLVGDGVVNIKPDLVDGEFAFNVTGASNVSMEGIDIALSTGGGINSVALRCAVGGGNPSLSFSQGTVSGSSGRGLVVTGCSFSIFRSKVSGNARGGIEINDSDFTIVNNFIVRNGTDDSTIGGIKVLNSVAKLQQFDFNTIASNRVGGFALATNFDCGVTTPLLATSNIIYGGLTEGAQPDLATINCSSEYSLIAGGQAGDGNLDEDPLFLNPVAGNQGDYHLQSTSPCIDAADPAATLDTDIDGDIRPQGDARDMGADEAG